jgi:serine/threonine protein kinase
MMATTRVKTNWVEQCLEENGIQQLDFITRGSNGSVYWTCYFKDCQGYVLKRGDISKKEYLISERMGREKVGPAVELYFTCLGTEDAFMLSERMAETLDERMLSNVPGGVGTHDADQFVDLMYRAFHRYGLLHHDMKTDNVMFNWDGELRIIDYGYAWCAVVDGKGSYNPYRYLSWIGVVPARIDLPVTALWDILCLIAYIEIKMSLLELDEGTKRARQYAKRNMHFYMRLRYRLIVDHKWMTAIGDGENKGRRIWLYIEQLIDDGHAIVIDDPLWQERRLLAHSSSKTFFDMANSTL